MKSRKEKNCESVRSGLFLTTVLTLSVLLLGCEPEMEEEDPLEMQDEDSLVDESQSEVEEILQAQGFDTSTLVFRDDGTVVVEEDIIMDVESVLEEGLDQIEKGYWIKKRVNNVSNIWITNDSSSPVSSTWVWAFVTAAADWNANSIVNFRFDTPQSGGNRINIRSVPYGCKTCTTNCKYGEADYPVSGRPGTEVRINSRYDCRNGGRCQATSINRMPWNQMVKIAAHELGHTLGFTHPGTGKRISRTKKESTGYSSIMWQGCSIGNTQISSTMTSDDIKSANKIYYPII